MKKAEWLYFRPGDDGFSTYRCRTDETELQYRFNGKGNWFPAKFSVDSTKDLYDCFKAVLIIHKRKLKLKKYNGR